MQVDTHEAHYDRRPQLRESNDAASQPIIFIARPISFSIAAPPQRV